MSSLLEQAIVDAEALKEVALKNAESAVIEKYSAEIKEAVETLLEAPEDDLGILPGEEGEEAAEEEEFIKDIPMAHEDDDECLDCPGENEPLEEIELDFTELEQEVEKELSQADSAETPGLNPEDMVDREDLGQELFETDSDVLQEMIDEEIELDEDKIKEIIEDLMVDVTPVPTGTPGGGTNNAEMEHQEDLLKAKAAADDEEELEEDEEKEELKESVTKLKKEKKTLLEQNDKFKNMLIKLKDKLQEVNLSNAKLLYTNRVLDSTSLNERQRNKIVEALSKADSVEEAKVIYETLQSAVGSSRKQAPQSLSEAVIRNRSTIMPRRREKVQNTQISRMQVLAGLMPKAEN